MSKNNQAVQTEIKNELKVYQGPLPPPNIMKDYEKVRAGTAEDIVKMAQEAQQHYILMEREDAKRAKLNLIFSFILGLVGQIGSIIITIAGFFMAYYYIQAGEATLGYWTAGTSAAICGYLVWWKIKEVEKDRNKRE